MSRKFRWLLPYLLACLGVLFPSLVHAQARQPESTLGEAAAFDVDQNRLPETSLDGMWRFHPGDDPDGKRGWAGPSFNDSSWPLLHSDQSWAVQGYPGMSGFAWYRFTIYLPARSRPVSLLLPPIITSYQVYADGHLIGAAGKMPPSIAPVAMFQFHQFPLPGISSPASGPRTLHIAIRVWHTGLWAGYIGGGPFRPGSLAGDPALIQAELLNRRNIQKFFFVDAYSFSIVAALVGLVILGLFYFRPKETEYLWFSVLMLSAGLDNALVIVYNVYSVLPIPVYDLLDGGLAAANQVAQLAFFSIVLRIRRGIFWKIAFVLALLSPIANLFYWPGWFSVPAATTLYLLCALPSSIWVLAVLVRHAIRRDANARLLLIPSVLYIGYFFIDNAAILLNQAGWIPIPDVLQRPLPLPPFTMHWQTLVNLIFLAALLGFLIRRFAIARRREERMDGALEAARQVQQLLLPEAIPQLKGFAIGSVYRPAESVGGDFFLILPAGDGDLLIVVGDVAGKGLPAAMMVSMIVGAMRTEAAHTQDPAELLASLNERMVDRSQGSFTTCLCAHITAGGQLKLASAGHLPPYMNGQELELEGAIPLGMIPGVVYDTTTLQLDPGDRLTFISDGVIEAQDKLGNLFGFERTKELSGLSAGEIAEAARKFGQADDITVVTIDFLAVLAAVSID